MSNNEIKYIEDEIKKILSSASYEYFQLTMREAHSEEDDYSGWTEDWLRDSIIRLYYCISSYLELKGLPILLQAFQENFKERIVRRTPLLESDLIHPDGDFELKILIEFKRFLSPFKSFDYKELKEEELSKLIGILKNTSFLIKNINCIITNEADIYKQVQWVLSLYYPSCRRRNKAAFIKQFKTYSPDILVPELKTAIEYKYLKDRLHNIDNFLDQILIDAKGYTGDHYYDNFIAVFYIGDAGIATPESIELAWKEKDLPNNWTLVITGDGISAKAIK